MKWAQVIIETQSKELMGKRELVALLNLSSWCLVMIERLFLTVSWGCLQFVIVVFPDLTHLLFLNQRRIWEYLLTRNLTFVTTYITKKVNIANRNLGIIFRSFPYMDKEMFLNIYKSMVRPHIEYATQVWSPQNKKDKITLENVQRRAARLVKCIKHLSYSERLKALGLPTLEYRRERANIIQVYKILLDIDKAHRENLFQMAAYTSTRGHPLKLFKKRCRLNLRKNYFSQRVIDQWNGLPINLVTAPSLNVFKSRLNKFWKDHPFKFRAACYLTEDEARLGKQPRKAPKEAT